MYSPCPPSRCQPLRSTNANRRRSVSNKDFVKNPLETTDRRRDDQSLCQSPYVWCKRNTVSRCNPDTRYGRHGKTDLELTIYLYCQFEKKPEVAYVHTARNMEYSTSVAKLETVFGAGAESNDFTSWFMSRNNAKVTFLVLRPLLRLQTINGMKIRAWRMLKSFSRAKVST